LSSTVASALSSDYSGAVIVKVTVAEGATISPETPEFSVDAGGLDRSIAAVAVAIASAIGIRFRELANKRQ
jgi:hypothetical protein